MTPEVHVIGKSFYVFLVTWRPYNIRDRPFSGPEVRFMVLASSILVSIHSHRMEIEQSLCFVLMIDHEQHMGEQKKKDN